MKIHSDILTASKVYDVLDTLKKDGEVVPTLFLDQWEDCGSRSKRNGIEIKVKSWQKLEGDGRRRPMYYWKDEDGNWAATYDEWGIIIAALYNIDGDAKIGPYNNVEHFHERTQYKF
jgi:hypothetical protein